VRSLWLSYQCLPLLDCYVSFFSRFIRLVQIVSHTASNRLPITISPTMMIHWSSLLNGKLGLQDGLALQAN